MAERAETLKPEEALAGYLGSSRRWSFPQSLLAVAPTAVCEICLKIYLILLQTVF